MFQRDHLNFKYQLWFIIISVFLMTGCGPSESSVDYNSARRSANTEGNQTPAVKKPSKRVSDKTVSESNKEGNDAEDVAPEGEGEVENVEDEANNEVETPVEEPKKLSFAADVAPIIEASCLGGCHPGLFTGRRDLGNFDAVKACGAVCVQEIDNGNMPQGRDMTPEQKAMFKQWVADGALP